MRNYSKRIEKLKYEIYDLEKDLLAAEKSNKTFLIKRLNMIINEKKQKIEKFSKLEMFV